MSEYTIGSESAVTVIAEDQIHVYDVSAKATGMATIGALAGVGAGVVDSTSTQITLTAASHASKTLTLSSTASTAIILPQATGTGNRYHVNLRVAATGTSHTLSVANATDVMVGVVHVMTSATITDVANIVAAFKTSATSDRVSINGTTTGGAIGDHFTFVDIKTGFFEVHGVTTATGTYATPFSAAV